MRHAVIFPLKANADSPPSAWHARLKRSFPDLSNVAVYIGVDADDDLWNSSHAAEARELLDFVEVVSPPTQEKGAVCVVWDRLARRAVADGIDGALVLFGDDVTYADGGDWLATRVAPALASDPLQLFHPIDATDASCCTFPIVGAAHVHRYKRLLPTEFFNQGADPWLHELYRRADRVCVLHDVTVTNARGGPVKV